MIDNELLNQLQINHDELFLLEQYKLKDSPVPFRLPSASIDLAPLAHRPWQLPFLSDNIHTQKGQTICVMKSRQLGFSECNLMSMLVFLTTHRNTKGLIAFPTKTQSDTFFATRVLPTLNSSPFFSRMVEKANTQMVTFNNGSALIFRSSGGTSNTATAKGAQGEGIDLDFLIMDEIERNSSVSQLAFLESLKSSKYGYAHVFSTPSLPSWGVAKIFEQSNQSIWMVKCEHCNVWQEITFPDSISQTNPKELIQDEHFSKGSFYFQCKRCKRLLDRSNGAYVAKYPNITDTLGFRITQLSFTGVTADDIYRNYYRYNNMALFSNYVLGIPYEDESVIVRESDIIESARFQQQKTSAIGYKHVIAGIDWGSTNGNWYLVLGVTKDNKYEILTVGREDNGNAVCDGADKIFSRISPYNPTLTIADVGDGKNEIKRMMELVGRNRFYGCQFIDKHDSAEITVKKNEADRKLTAYKTDNALRVLNMLKRHEIGVWKQNDTQLQVFIKHCFNSRVIDREDADGRPYKQYARLGDDHLFCCLIYAILGAEELIPTYNKSQNNMSFMFLDGNSYGSGFYGGY